jgi:ABC-type cobalamin transport system permease subunit
MIRRFTQLESMEATRLVHSQIYYILQPLLFLAIFDILVNPHILFLPRLRLLLWWLMLLLRLLIALISRTLATAGACLFLLYGCHLGRAIPIIQPDISSLVLVIRAIELP